MKPVFLKSWDLLGSFYEQHKNSPLFWLFCFFAGSIVLIAPLWGDRLYWVACGDTFVHTRTVRSAYVSLFQEFSFPPLCCNDLGIMLQPIFRYYSCTIHMLSACFMLTGLSAYQSLLLGASIFYALGAWGVFLTARFFRCDPAASFIGGLAYLYSPLMLADLYARASYAEISALGIIPLLFYVQIRLSASRRAPWGALTALLTALLLISHKIFFPWHLLLSALFVILISMSRCEGSRAVKYGLKKILFRRLFPLFLWTSAGMAMSSAYWLASYINFPNTVIAKLVKVMSPSLTHWKYLLSPFFAVAPESTVPALATQFGMPVVLGALILSAKNRSFAGRALVSLFVLLFVVESNMEKLADFMPMFLKGIQFSFRLLVFSAWFGALSLSLALRMSFAKKRRNAARLFFFILVIIYCGLYRKIPVFTDQTSSDAEKASYDVMLHFNELQWEEEKIKRYAIAGIELDGWLLQDPVVKFPRRPDDEARLHFSALSSGWIQEKSDHEIDISIDRTFWKKKIIKEDRPIELEELLPSVSKPVVQEIQLHFSKQFVPKEMGINEDTRTLTLFRPQFKRTNNYQTVIGSSALTARGSRVLLQLEMKKGHEYILPVMYSKYLRINPDSIKISPHPDGLILESGDGGVFDIILERKEMGFLTALFWIALAGLAVPFLTKYVAVKNPIRVL